MKISWKWLSELVDLKGVTPQDLASLLTQRGLEVEAIERQDHGFEKVITAQILKKEKHPQADRLSLCEVSTGGGAPLEIVCGAQNMKPGDKVALAQVGAHLPNGVKIEQSKIRGVVSNGMLCSEEELKLKSESEGILILPSSTPLGKPLAQILGRDDTVLAFKLTANRGDCLSHWGMARETAAALGRKLHKLEAKPLKSGGSPISIHLDAGSACPQFFGCFMEGVKIGPSPDWVVKRLEALGSRSINNVVDASNLVMLELGHPVHAYDAEKLRDGRIGVRVAKKGEQLPLLDSSTVTLEGFELVIVDGKDGDRAVGLAGVMGGGNSEVSAETTRIFLECAEFNSTLVRRAAFKHQKRTDAAHRFERGVDPENLSFVIARLATWIQQLAGGTVKGTGSAHSGKAPKARESRREIRVDPEFIGKFLGMPVSAEKAEKILKGLDCEIAHDSKGWKVSPPSYRLDLNIPEDLAEEIARTVGYDQIPETLPPLTTGPHSERNSQTDLAKDVLRRAGLNETLNFAFTSKVWLSQFGMKANVTVINPLSEENEAMVPSLLPGLVRNALDNWNHHFGSELPAIRLFELRPAFSAQGEVAARGESETGVQERWKLALALSGPRFQEGLRAERGEVDFYDLKAVVESLFESLGTKGVRYAPCTSPLFHPGQSVDVILGKDSAGSFGLFHPGPARALKARAPLWIAELDWERIAQLSRPASEPLGYRPVSDFPPIERDFALVVQSDIASEKIAQVALKAGKPLAKVATIFDIYRGPPVAEGMTSVAVRVIFYDEARSLQESEAEAASTRILEAWKKELGAELRG